jgi:soluble lytic murein transglycosylase-like protein
MFHTPAAPSYVSSYAGSDGVVYLSGSGRKSGRRAMSATGQRNRRQYEPLIAAAADKYSLDPALLHAVIRAESGYNPEAVSNKGAAGLMQLMPATAARFGVRDRFDPLDNIEGGARYLSTLIGMFDSDLRLAVAAYNSGENTVKKFGNQVPPITETRNYVERVLGYYRQ